MKFKWTIYKKIQILIFSILLVVFVVSNLVLSKLIEDNVRENFSNDVMKTSILLQNST